VLSMTEPGDTVFGSLPRRGLVDRGRAHAWP